MTEQEFWSAAYLAAMAGGMWAGRQCREQADVAVKDWKQYQDGKEDTDAQDAPDAALRDAASEGTSHHPV